MISWLKFLSKLDSSLIDDFAFYPLARNHIPIEQFRVRDALIPKSLKRRFNLNGGLNYLANIIDGFVDWTCIFNSLTRLNVGYRTVINRNSNKAHIIFKLDSQQNALNPHIGHWKYAAGVVQ